MSPLELIEWSMALLVAGMAVACVILLFIWIKCLWNGEGI